MQVFSDKCVKTILYFFTQVLSEKWGEIQFEIRIPLFIQEGPSEDGEKLVKIMYFGFHILHAVSYLKVHAFYTPFSGGKISENGFAVFTTGSSRIYE
jgi:hypothetical protein